MPRLSNEQIIDACTVQIRADAATISRLKKDAATAARSAEINSRVAKAASAARDARPITITGREARGPFALPIAREMVKRSAGIEHHATNITKAAKAAAPDAATGKPGDAIRQSRPR